MIKVFKEKQFFLVKKLFGDFFKRCFWSTLSQQEQEPFVEWPRQVGKTAGELTLPYLRLLMSGAHWSKTVLLPN